MKTPIALAGAAMLAAATPPSAASEGGPALTPQTAAAVLADGAAWTVETAAGRRKFDLTLNPNGTGRLRGPLRLNMAVSWRIEGDDLCLESAFMEKCLRFSEEPTGLQGWERGQPDLRLVRGSEG